MIMVILDNSATAMTGFQPHPGVKNHSRGEVNPIDIERVCRAFGASVEVADPFDLQDTKQKLLAMLEEGRFPGQIAIDDFDLPADLVPIRARGPESRGIRKGGNWSRSSQRNGRGEVGPASTSTLRPAWAERSSPSPYASSTGGRVPPISPGPLKMQW